MQHYRVYRLQEPVRLSGEGPHLRARARSSGAARMAALRARHPEPILARRASMRRGSVLEQNRNAHQWRRVRYSYMDCRRQARKRGLVIRGPQKIWDSSLAAAGMLYRASAPAMPCSAATTTAVFERFWKRELDIEDVAVIGRVLAEAGADEPGFRRADAALRDEVARHQPCRGGDAACSACRVSSSMASCSGAASICPTSARCSRRTDATGGNAMRAAIFRNGDIVVDTIADPTPGDGPGAGEDAVLRHLRHRSARGEVHPAVRRALAPRRRTLADGSGARRGVRPRILLRDRRARPRHRAAAEAGHTGLLDADDDRRHHGAGHRLFQRHRRRLRAVHAAGRAPAAGGAERTAGRQGRADRADRGRLARGAERAPRARTTCRW